jgi:bifunctional non-homologous end joining protein LigD
VQASRPDKLIFPAAGLTKQDLVDHYERVAPLLLPHLAGRPLTLERYPNGVAAKGFLQKNTPRHFPETIGRVEVPKNDGTVAHPLVDRPEDLLFLADQGTIGFHVWQSRLPRLDRPDRLVIDLDPPAGDLAGARFAARVVGELLDAAGFPSGLVATGSKGFHVVVPLVAEAGFDRVERAGRLVAGMAAAAHPERLTTEFLIRERGGRVFVDWLRNRWAQTRVAPWSLRPRPRAPVAMPIAWEELASARPDGWTLRSVEERLAGTPPLPTPVSPAGPLAAVEEAAARLGVSADEPIDRFGRRDVRPSTGRGRPHTLSAGGTGPDPREER